MRPIRCPETSVKDHHSALRNISEERRSHLHRGGCLKSHHLCVNKSRLLMPSTLMYFTKHLATDPHSLLISYSGLSKKVARIPSLFSERFRVRISAPGSASWLRWYHSVPPGSYWDSTKSYATNVSFQILDSSLFTVVIRRYITWVTCVIIKYSTKYSVFLLSLSWSPQLSQDIPANTGFLCDKAAVLGDTIKKTYVRKLNE